MSNLTFFYFSSHNLLIIQGASVYRYPGEIDIAKGKLLTTIPFLDKEHYVAFEMMITRHTPGNWRNVLHLTTGNDSGNYGSRTPAVFLFYDGRIHTSSAIDGNPNFVWYDPFYTSRKPGVWVKLEFKQMCLWGQVFLFVCKLHTYLLISVSLYYQN